MQLDAIKLFCDVAAFRSISKAAEHNGVTQSAVSQRLQVLERELGVKLIDRSTRPLQLTGAGEIYHTGCRQILDQYERLKQQISPGEPGVDQLHGTVRVAAIYSAGIDLLNQVVERFHADHPQTEVEVQYLQPEAVHEHVRNEQVDLGILSYPKRWRDLLSQPLREEVMAVVCRSGHPLAGRREVEPGDLADETLVGFDATLPISRHITAYLRRHDVAPEIGHTFDNIDTIKAYLTHSNEVAILPERTVRAEVEGGTLAAIRLKPTLVRPLAIVYHRQRRFTPLIEVFVKYLTDSSSERPSKTSKAAVHV